MKRADKDLVKEDNVKALEERIREGMDTNAIDQDGETILHVAAFYESIKCLRLLVQRGADVAKGDRCKSTPLHFATWKGNAKCVKVCPKAGGGEGERRSLFLCVDIFFVLDSGGSQFQRECQKRCWRHSFTPCGFSWLQGMHANPPRRSSSSRVGE